MTNFYDYTLKFTNETEAKTILVSTGIYELTELPEELGGVSVYISTQGYFIDEIGLLPVYNPDPEADIVMGEGWHVNLRTTEELAAEIAADLPILPTPQYPKRAWA